MASKSIVVLAPNGHRQTVKVSPNTTILQVIEEVCQKHGYNVNKYDLKHQNNVLDSNAIIRFTGLVNNAQVAMVARKVERASSPVVIGLQLETGNRLTGEFMADTTILNVLESLCPEQDLDRAVIIYMHTEVNGKEAFEKTTLMSLGLSSGKAMLRLIHRNPDAPKTQAHVSAPLARKSDTTSNDSNRKQNNVSTFQYLKNKVLDPIAMLKAEKEKMWKSKGSAPASKKDKRQEISRKVESIKQNMNKRGADKPTPSTSKAGNKSERKNEGSNQKDEEFIEKVEFLGSRHAFVFNQAKLQAMRRDELPDNFFDLTVNDAKVLIRDAKRRKEELEEAPLLTEAQRQLGQETRMLQQLHKYRHTVIRVHFPDQFILQGLFGPLETVQAIKDFVKEYVVNPNSEFTIYTSPPKCDLKTESRLIDADLVPSAVVHYSGSSTLKADVKKKVTDPRSAIMQTAKFRQEAVRDDVNELVNESDKTENTELEPSRDSTSEQPIPE